MRRAITFVLPALLLGLGWHVSAQPADVQAINTLTAQETKDGWQLLFDGKSLDGWRVYKQKDAGNWKVKDGLLISGDKDLITREQYANFELQIDWKFDKGSNSGILYRVGEEGEHSYQTGPEMQIMTHPPNTKINKNGGGAIFDLLAPTENAFKPAKEWNTFKIVANGKHVEHWVNGVKVVACDIGSDEWNKAVANSKWKNEKLYAARTAGHIALQDYHGHKIHFRNIKIRVLADTAAKKNDAP